MGSDENNVWGQMKYVIGERNLANVQEIKKTTDENLKNLLAEKC